MSRIVVKNLPKNVTEDYIRKLFGQKGNITDVQLKYTLDGKFRQFCFIGYDNEKEAKEAIDYFNNTRINTNKISVDLCAPLGDKNKPKAWSKYASDNKGEPASVEKNGKSEDEKKESESRLEAFLEKYKDDPQFEEFINLNLSNKMKEEIRNRINKLNNQKQTENQIKVNDDENTIENETKEIGDEEEKDKLALRKISDFQYMKLLMRKSQGVDTKQVKEKIKLYTVKVKGLPYKCKKKDIKHFFKPLVPYTIRIPPKVKGFAYVGFKIERHANQALLKNKSFILGKQVQVVKYTSKDNIEEMPENPKIKKWKSQEESLQNEEDIAESGRIFIRNLAYSTTEDDIQDLFSQYGPLTEVNLPLDPTTRKIKGFGVITFLMPEHAVKAYTELDGTILHGRMLHLLPGKAKDVADEEIDSKNYKKAKSAKEKAQAGFAHNWNSLFLGHNAVAEVIAQNYGTTKEAVIDPHGDSNAAVRLALGETQIVQSTKKFLEQEGVLLDAFEQPNCKRSKTIILVKNLPSQTSAKELRELFEKFGVLGRVILPPSGITALVEFVEPFEARKAFTKLAYSKFKHMPLYLEWAPENSLCEKPKVDDSKLTKRNDEDVLNKNKIENEESKKDDHSEEEEEETPEPDTTLFVKNLNFQTTSENLKKHFESCGKVYYANVAMKKDKKNPQNMLSMGYGFVQFLHKASCNKALKTLQQSILDGKPLELKRSERTLKSEIKTFKKKPNVTKQTGTKILVRNVPFQVHKKEIFDLFRTFGELKDVRLPKKMSADKNSHRGFAFVDFTSATDAKKAFEALCQSTHLYGRRLVLEWAATEGVDEIRKRTADHFHPTKEVDSKRSVLDVEKT